MPAPITFNPGPSRLSEETKEDLRRAIEEGIGEISHRSTRFSDISSACLSGLRALLGIPDSHLVFYLDSATSAWHSIAANAVDRRSFHFVNGAFSARARDAALALGKEAAADEAPWGGQNDLAGAKLPPATELVTVCLNETSTGVAVRPDALRALRAAHPEPLLAADATSCAGGVPVPFDATDLCYFAVQKCFGLPAGLGLLAVSPRALERSRELSRAGRNLAGLFRWESLVKPMTEQRGQTLHTPNVLAIWLLGEQCRRWNAAGGLARLAGETMRKSSIFEAWIAAHPVYRFFVPRPEDRSATVLAVEAPPEAVKAAHDRCAREGILLGKGYGKIRETTFRVANFPAIPEADARRLAELLAGSSSLPGIPIAGS